MQHGDTTPTQESMQRAARMQASDRARREGRPFVVLVDRSPPLAIWYVRGLDETVPEGAEVVGVEHPPLPFVLENRIGRGVCVRDCRVPLRYVVEDETHAIASGVLDALRERWEHVSTGAPGECREIADAYLEHHPRERGSS